MRWYRVKCRLGQSNKSDFLLSRKANIRVNLPYEF